MTKIAIEKYIPYFHDGSIIGIEHTQNEIIISMQSAQIDEQDLTDKIELSKYQRIKGKLHIRNPRSILFDETEFAGILKMPFDKGSIFDFIWDEKFVELQIAWTNFPPKQPTNEFSVIRIEADDIWWENIPDLLDPFW